MTILWLDLETTGLDNTLDPILEIGAILTNDDLEEISRFHGIRRPTAAVMNRLEANEFVRDMHTRNGLLEEMKTAADMEFVLAQFDAWLDNYTDPDDLPPLAGNTVHFDRASIANQHPDLMVYFHYRNFDISTLNRFTKMWAPHVYEHCERDRESHRAIPDIEDSLTTAVNYRDYLAEPAEKMFRAYERA